MGKATGSFHVTRSNPRGLLGDVAEKFWVLVFTFFLFYFIPFMTSAMLSKGTKKRTGLCCESFTVKDKMSVQGGFLVLRTTAQKWPRFDEDGSPEGHETLPCY